MCWDDYARAVCVVEIETLCVQHGAWNGFVETKQQYLYYNIDLE